MISRKEQTELVLHKEAMKIIALALSLCVLIFLGIFIRPTHDGKLSDEVLPVTIVGNLNVSESDLIGVQFSSLVYKKIEYEALHYNLDEFIKMERILENYSIILHEAKSDKKYKIFTRAGLVDKVDVVD